MNRMGSKSGSIVIVGVLVLSGFLFLVPSHVSAQTPYYSDASRDGYIYGSVAAPAYPPTGTDVDTTGIDMDVGQFHGGPGHFNMIFRGYISFDTSSLPDGAVILTAKMFLKVSSDSSTLDFDVQVWENEYETLDVSDWNNSMAYQGVLLNTASAVVNSWYSFDVKGSSVNTTGYTAYTLKSDMDNNTVPSGSEHLWFYTGDSAFAPYILITYTLQGTTVTFELVGGATLESVAFADIQEWNLTYELWCFEIDTIPTTENISIEKQNTSWEVQGIVPLSNYTSNSTHLLLEDVADSICYRVWFTVPKANPYSTVHLSLYNQFTGEGFFWENMKVEYCEGNEWNNTTSEQLARPDFNIEPETNYTLRVLDYFDNVLYEYTFMANSQELSLNLPIPYYSWQIFNMNEAPVLVSIYWNNSGTPWQFFVGPQWIIERNLKGGNYTFMVTFYNTDGTAGSTVYYNQAIPLSGLNASFIYVNGTGLSQIISSLEGVLATQQIITNLVSPSMVIVYEDLPLAPVKLRALALNTRIALDPYLILEATTYQNQTGTQYINTSLSLPHAQSVGSTYYNIADTLTFSGSFATNIFVNDTLGNVLYSNSVLPAVVVLDGQNITVWADQNYSVSRATTFREISEYIVIYYSTQKKYETTIDLNNSCPFDYYSPYWYIAFPQNTTIDQDTVTLYDLDNAIYLSQRTNFDVTAGGIHVTLNRLNTTNSRNFRLTYWDENGTTGIGAPNLISEAYTDSTLNSVPMKYTSVQWVNPWSVEYSGEVYITLNFSGGDNLKRSSITIIDQTSGTTIPNSQYIYTGRTIIILTDGVGTVPVGGARNYAVYFTFESGGTVTKKQDAFFGPITWGGNSLYIANFAVSWFIVILILMAVITAWLWYEDKEFTFMLIMTVGIAVVGTYLSRFMG